jgi:hypothetical protein
MLAILLFSDKEEIINKRGRKSKQKSVIRQCGMGETACKAASNGALGETKKHYKRKHRINI